MADTKRKKLELVTSPVGTLVWPHLNKPDTKFAKDGSKGDYRTELRLKRGDPGVDEFELKINNAYAAAVEEGKAKYEEAKAAYFAKVSKKDKTAGKKPEWKVVPNPIKPVVELVDDVETETGEITLSAKMAAFVKPMNKDGWFQEPALYDSAKRSLGKVATAPRIGSGSQARVAFELNPFYTGALGAGLSLRLQGVQILTLVQFNSKSADQLGFGEDSGSEGFVYEPSASDETAGGGEPAAGGAGSNEEF